MSKIPKGSLKKEPWHGKMPEPPAYEWQGDVVDPEPVMDYLADCGFYRRQTRVRNGIQQYRYVTRYPEYSTDEGYATDWKYCD